MQVSPNGSDRIYGFTKFVAALLGGIVLYAFVVLYFFPTHTKQLFAWPIAPPMTAMFIGAAYANGVVFFANVLLGKKWHRVWAPHIGVFTFATLLLIATFLHWDRFTHGHPVFYIWVFIYVVAPILTPIALIRNLREDRHLPEERDAIVPQSLRIVWLIPALAFLLLALYGFANPSAIIPHWPWKATPLTMRVIMSFYALVGVGPLVVQREARWSSWRIGVIGVIVWHALVIAAALLRRADFKAGSLGGWWIIVEIILLAAAAVTFVIMETRAKTSRTVS
ncbi:MAG: hypothetical protein QOG48_1382 [Verrucomicrobiota bacterium]